MATFQSLYLVNLSGDTQGCHYVYRSWWTLSQTVGDSSSNMRFSLSKIHLTVRNRFNTTKKLLQNIFVRKLDSMLYQKKEIEALFKRLLGNKKTVVTSHKVGKTRSVRALPEKAESHLIPETSREVPPLQTLEKAWA